MHRIFLASAAHFANKFIRIDLYLMNVKLKTINVKYKTVYVKCQMMLSMS